MFLLLANRLGGSPNFGELETSKKCESHFVKTRAFLQLANKMLGDGGPVVREESLEYATAGGVGRMRGRGSGDSGVPWFGGRGVYSL